MADQIIKQYYDSNLMSGSGDLFRNAVSSYIKVVSSSVGEALSKNEYTLEGTKINMIYESPNSFWTTASADTILKSVSFACSIQGDHNIIAGDDQWLAYVKGGSYEDINYSGIVTAGTFEIDMLTKRNTYDLLSAKAISETNYTSYKTHAHTYFYNYRLHGYETQQINSDTKFKALPNLYLISYGIFNPDLHFEKENANLFDLLYFSEYSSSYQGFSRDNTLRTNFMEGTQTAWVPLESLTSPRSTADGVFSYADPYFGAKDYLNKYAIDGISSSASNYAIANAGDLIFNKAGVETTFESSHTNAPNQPYYAKIDLPFYSSDRISEALITSDFHNILLNEIAGAFVDNRDLLNSSDLIVENQQDAVGISTSIITEKTATNTTLPYLNLYDLLIQYSNTGTPLYGNSSFYFIGSQGISEKAAQDVAGNLRYVNKIAADAMILELQELSGQHSFTPWASPSDPDDFGHKLILEDLESNAQNDVVAMRIEKTDTVTGEVQNIIIQNQQPSTPSTGISSLSAPDDCWKYYDTQVVYGRSYTYNIYAYVASVGFKYEYSDIAVSRQINTTVVIDGNEQICIEFFDPATSEARTSPMDTAGLLAAGLTLPKGGSSALYWRKPLASLATSGYATTAQEMAGAGSSPYYADFRMTVSPTFKIFECPVNSKTITILDHPPTNLEVIPYQVKDNSQKVGMFIRLESFTPQTYANLFTPEKNANKSQYLNSNNLLPSENIASKSVSRPRYIEVYRLNQKPTSIIDFEDSLVFTKDLLLDNYPDNPTIDETTIISSCFFYEEKITTNYKFYYIARYVSEHNVPGAWSPIQEIELVDDGGYKYIVTDTLRVADLGAPPQDSNVVDPYKKIFRLIPNVNQMIMDTSNVDYNDVASSQISNISLATDSEDSIWGKTFKIRLTSKKTGKKIDLNVTYNLKEQA